MRSYGPLSESVLMDKACREVTRDTSKILSFIQKEKDPKKKDALLTLFHSIKYFVDTYDGCDAIVRAEKQFARHVVHVWGLLLQQENGRKIIVVTMNGITTPGCHYYAYWGNCRGVSTAQMNMLETYMEEMRVQATTPAPSIAQEADYRANDTDLVGDGNVTTDGGVVGNDDPAGDADHTPAIVDAGTAPIDVALRDRVCANIVSLDEFRDLTIDDLVDRVVKRTRDILWDLKDQEETNQTNRDTTANGELEVNATIDVTHDEPMDEAIEDDGADREPEPNIGWKNTTIARSMEDSGVMTHDSQMLPKPNLTIEGLDDEVQGPNGDGFSEDSWFDSHAQAIIASTPGDDKAVEKETEPPLEKPVQGKLTIEISSDKYVLLLDQWSNRLIFDNFDILQQFLYDVVKGPTRTDWFHGNRHIKRKYYRNNDPTVRNFPNFELTGQPSEIFPTTTRGNPVIDLNESYYSISNKSNLVNSYNELIGNFRLGSTAPGSVSTSERNSGADPEKSKCLQSPPPR